MGLISAIASTGIYIINLYTFLLFVYIIISLLANFGIINLYHPFARGVMHVLAILFEPFLVLIRSVIPPVQGIDFSPVVLYFVLFFVEKLLYQLV